MGTDHTRDGDARSGTIYHRCLQTPRGSISKEKHLRQSERTVNKTKTTVNNSTRKNGSGGSGGVNAIGTFEARLLQFEVLGTTSWSVTLRTVFVRTWLRTVFVRRRSVLHPYLLTLRGHVQFR